MSLTEVYCLVNRARGLEVRNLWGALTKLALKDSHTSVDNQKPL